MATIYRFPICLWRSSPETVTARVVDDGYEEVVVTAGSRKEAVSQIKEYLRRLSREDSWKLFAPDFIDAELRVLKLTVLPEYERNGRTYPCRVRVRLRLPCVTGRRAAGSPIAFLPTLGEFFDYHREDGFQQVATHIAQRELAGRTPAELSRLLPPEDVKLDRISITLKEGSRGRDRWERSLSPLTEVADHLGGGGFGRVGRTWEREREVNELVRLLDERHSSVCLVGEAGCGKTAILIEAARRIERAAASDGGGKRRLFWLTNAGRLVAGMRWLGQWQERLEGVIERVGSIPGVLCVEDLTELVRLGGQTPESGLAAFLVPFLESGELRIVGELTPAGLDACDRLLPGLVDRLSLLKLDPLSPDQARRVVTRAAEHFSRHDGVTFSAGAALRVHDLHARYQPYVAFPGKVIQFMGTLVDATHNAPSGAGEPEIRAGDAERHFAETSGLPGWLVREGEGIGFPEMRAGFREKLVAQDEAIDSVCRVVAKFAAGLNDPARPLGVLLFCGPTGVGKTQLVRLLGDFLFPHRPEKERLVRLDMSEYAGPDAPRRLLGGSSGEPSDLIRRMRAHPFAVLLLDEIEKASDEVFDILLNVFEEGRLTDPLGRVTSFQSALIVMTSNLGAGASGPLGFRTDAARAGAAPVHAAIDRSAVASFFRPEFFNRLDRVIWFQALGREAVETIARKELGELARREGFAQRGLRLEFDDGIAAAVANTGFDPAYGARPLQRAVEETVAVPLGRFLAARPEVRRRTLRVRWADGAAEIEVE